MSRSDIMVTSGIKVDSHRFKYGGGSIILTIAFGCAIGLFYAYDDFTSAKIQWRLFSTKLPIIIPHQVIVGAWWGAFLICLLCIVMAALPAANVIVGENDITAQGLITRKFTTVAYHDILDLTIDKNYIRAIDRNNNKIYFARLFLSKAAFRAIKDRLESSAHSAS